MKSDSYTMKVLIGITGIICLLGDVSNKAHDDM